MRLASTKLSRTDLKEFLDEKAEAYNHPRFIETDPVRIPHSFTMKEDRELAGFLTAVMAWGNRKAILKSAARLMQLMDDRPYDFVMNHKRSDLKVLSNFVHRTFNSTDLVAFITALKKLYRTSGGLEGAFTRHMQAHNDMGKAISQFKTDFFSQTFTLRSHKHLPDPMRGSAAKRINMFLRWMVRQDGRGVDLGLWRDISPSQLSIPLDVHTGNVSRSLGLLNRRQNDWKAVQELDALLRHFDPHDPVKYDFALFGLGIFEHFGSD